MSGKLAKGVLMGWEPAAGMGPGWLQAFRGGGRLAGGEGEDHAPGARAQVKHLQIMLAFSFFLSFFLFQIVLKTKIERERGRLTPQIDTLKNKKIGSHFVVVVYIYFASFLLDVISCHYFF